MIKTTVCVMDTTLVQVKNLKIHPRQSSEDVILNLIKFYKNHQTMSNDGVKYMLNLIPTKEDDERNDTNTLSDK